MRLPCGMVVLIVTHGQNRDLTPRAGNPGRLEEDLWIAAKQTLDGSA